MKYKNKGYMSIEASIVFSTTILVVFSSLYLLLIVYQRSVMRNELEEDIFTIPYSYVKSENVENYLASISTSDRYVIGDLQKELWDSRNRIYGEMKIVFQGEYDVNASTEYGLQAKRLRRWQLYDSIGSDEGDE